MWLKVSLRVSLLLMILTLSGCFVLPIPKYTSTKSCAKVFKEYYVYAENLNFMTPGSTTRDIIIEKLGNPDVIKKQENTLGYYQWTETIGNLNWYFGIFGGYSGGIFNAGSTPMRKVCLLLIKFNDYNVLEQFMIKGVFRGSLNNDTEWVQLKELPINYNDKPHISIKKYPKLNKPTIEINK